MTKTFQVKLPNSQKRSYRIVLKQGLLADIPAILVKQYAGRAFFVITDSKVAQLYGSRLQRSMSASGLNTLMLDFQAGEPSKNFLTVHALHTELLKAGIRRGDVIIALGGGVVGDIAGYVAATILRGVEYFQVPTTLLAQVDSSIGGKVGIDHPLGKNLIGAFHQPKAVLIDPLVLKTLPVAEFNNGLAEIVKIAAALDARLFAFIERNAYRLHRNNTRLLERLILESASLKASVVSRDEFEYGLRKTLNLGHTIGHAVETAMGYKIRHGEAVSIGMAMESKLSVQMKILAPAELKGLIGLLTRLRLPVQVPRTMNIGKFCRALALDKKGEGSMSKFVLLHSIGASLIGIEVIPGLVRKLLTQPAR